MAKITDYEQLTSPQAADVLVIVDVSDQSMSPEGTTKQVLLSAIQQSGTVTSVNGQTGAVTLTASNVNADPSGAAAAAQAASDPVGSASAAQSASLQKSQNLADIPSPSAARSSLQLGTAATMAASAFDAAGAASAAQSAAESYATGLQPTANAPLPLVLGGTGVSAASDAALLTSLGAAASSALTAETTRATSAEALLAPLASPAFTGTPAAPTATAGTSTTQIATTAFAAAAAAAAAAASLPLAGGTMTGRIVPKVVTLTDGATVALNAALGNDFRWSLSASGHTLGAPTNPADGQQIEVVIIYGGAYAPAFATGTGGYGFGTGGAPSWTSVSGSIDIAGFKYMASISTWAFIGATFGVTAA